MKSRCFAVIITAVSLVRMHGSVLAQTSPADNVAPQASASELQSIRSLLQQQDEEIRQLRDRLSSLQSDVRQLPPVQLETAPGLAAPSEVVPAAAASGPTTFDLQDRLTSLEQKVDQQIADKSSAPKGYEVGSDLKMTASWRNGVQFESANKDFRFHVGGRVQWDISLFDNDQALLVAPAKGGIGPQPDSTQFRRARIRLDGTMYEVFDWVAEYDFANTLATAAPTTGQPVATVPGLTELSITWTQLPYLGNFRVGNQREPMGLEHLTSDVNLPFLERSYLRDAIWGPFNNGYTPGMEFYNNWGDEQDGTWAVGMFSNQADSFGFGIGDETAVTGRLTWLPYYDEPTNGGFLWHVGVSGSSRRPDNGQVRIRTRGDIRSGPPGVLNPIYADTGTMAANTQNIAGAETAIVWGSLTVQAEYVGTWIEDAVEPIKPPDARGTPFFQGGYVQFLWFLTGEHDVYNRRTGVFEGPVPSENAFCVRNCNGECKGWGAWQIGFRYNAIDLEDNGINGGILNSYTVGLNWFWTPNAKFQFNYDLTHRSEVKTVEPGFINGWGTRFAYFF